MPQDVRRGARLTSSPNSPGFDERNYRCVDPKRHRVDAGKSTVFWGILQHTCGLWQSHLVVNVHLLWKGLDSLTRLAELDLNL